MTKYQWFTPGRTLGGVLTAALLMAAPATAQVAWESPRMIGPSSPGGVGFYWIRSNAQAEEVDGGVATLPVPGMGGNVMLRGGVVTDAADEVSAFAGIDLRAPIARATADQPLDVEWHAGIGAGNPLEGERHTIVTVPTGVSAGRSFQSGSIWFAPYVGVGVVFQGHLGPGAPADEFEVQPAVDLGLDLALDESRRFVIRTAMSLGDRQALLIGLNIGGAR